MTATGTEGRLCANETQIGGSHYKEKGIQPWDYITENNIGYLEGCAIKYLSRWDRKGGMTDLEKAKHYIEKLIEVEIASSAASGEIPANQVK